MIVYFIQRINRQISKLFICYQMRIVSIDQITFIDSVFTIGVELVKTLK